MFDIKTVEDKEKDAAEQAALEADRLRDEVMLTGKPFTLNGVEYQVSFTKDDGDGMIQVKNGFELGLGSTNIHFKNGTKMPISASDFPAFASWFVTERNKFFV